MAILTSHFSRRLFIPAFCIFYFLISIAHGQIILIDNSPAITCSGTFYDSGGPNGNYANGETLTKTLTSTAGQRVRIKFNQFSCSAGDVLRIYDGASATAPPLKMLIIGLAPADSVVESSGSSLFFSWTSNATGTQAGWAATISCFGQAIQEYTMTGGQTITSCAGVFFDPGGEANGYGENLSLTSTICSGTNQSLLFSFSFNEIGPQDSLLVYDGNSTSGQLLQTYTYGSVIQPFLSPGTCVTFRLVSDGASGQNGGWRATFACSDVGPTNTVFNLSNGLRTVPCSGSFFDQGGAGAPYSEAINPYRQTLRSANGSRLRFTFGSASLEQGSDYLYIYDGPNTGYPLLGKYTGSSLAGKTLESTGDALTFYFQGNGGNQGPSGWSSTFVCTSPAYPEYPMANQTVNACTGRFFDAGGPVHPNPEGSSFTQSFCAPAGKRLVFSFLPELIESPITYIGSPVLGGNDSLFVYDGPSVNSPLKAIQVRGQFADGFMSFEKLTSTGNCLTFQLKKTPGSVTNWWASFTCEDFPAPDVYLGKTGIRYVQAGTFADDGGLTGNYAFDIFNFTGGTTTLRSAIPGGRVRVNFSQFATEDTRDVLTIYDGNQLVGSYSGNTSPGLVTSSGSELRFTWQTDASDVFSGWKADIGVLASVPVVGTIGAASYCAGEQIFFPFTSPAAANDNVFTAQLSDASGDFSNPTTIGTTPGIQGGTFAVTLPNNLTTSGQYRIRINSANPVWTGIASLPFGIRSAAPQPATITGPDTLCAGTQNLVYTVAPNPLISSYVWTVPAGGTILSGQGTNSITVNWTGPGEKTLRVAGTNACGNGPSRDLSVLVKPVSALFVTIDSPAPTTVCEGSNLSFASTIPTGANPQYQWRVNGQAVPGATFPVYILTGVQSSFTISLAIQAGAGTCFSNSQAISNILSYTVVDTVVPTVNIASVAGGNTVCAGQSLGLSVSTTQAGTAPAFQWFQNGNPITGATQSTYNTPTNLNSNTIYTVRLTSNALCARPPEVLSPEFEVNVNTFNNAQFTISGQPLTLSAQPANAQSYQWWLNGNPISGATQPTYIPQSAGLYAVVIVLNGCADTSAAQFISLVSNQMPIEKGEWDIFPNPAIDQVWIKGNGPASIRMVDVLGKVLVQTTYEGIGPENLSVDHLPAGFYWLVIQGKSSLKQLGIKLVR